MTNPSTSVHVVVAEASADQLLHQEGLFIGAARGGDATNGIATILGLDALELTGGISQSLVPCDLAPWICDLFADHRRGNAVLVRSIAPGEAALDAGMAFIRLAALVGDHTHDGFTLHLCLE